MKFSEMGLAVPIQKAIKQMGYDSPTPIQEKAIPLVLGGKDVLASAQTGTGKTAAFVLPLLERFFTENRSTKEVSRKAIVLILSPTRELAEQIHENVCNYGRHLSIRSHLLVGGLNIEPQIKKLAKGSDILIATPGRLIDLQQRRKLDLGNIKSFVLDEADRMLDMGFAPALATIKNLLPAKRQNLLFSATFSQPIMKLAKKFAVNPIEVKVTPANSTSKLVRQSVQMIEKKSKALALTKLVSENKWSQVLVFTKTKHGANRLVKYLAQNKMKALAIHGNKSQSARKKALESFKSGSTNILVATDVASRGIDIKELGYVVNYELPNVPEDYVHRIGRTGRAGANGEAVSFVSPEEKVYLRNIEKLTKSKIRVRQANN